jgi:hypothetical protein
MCHFPGDEETTLSAYAELCLLVTEYSVMSLIETRAIFNPAF